MLQPMIAIVLGIRGGLADAKAGNPHYLLGLLFHAEHRKEYLRSGVAEIRNLLAAGIILDIVFQLIPLGASGRGLGACTNSDLYPLRGGQIANSVGVRNGEAMKSMTWAKLLASKTVTALPSLKVTSVNGDDPITIRALLVALGGYGRKNQESRRRLLLFQ